MNRTHPTPDQIRRLRSCIRLAFRDLRRQGVFARMNFKCCMTCATAAMPKDRPSAYYHSQDNEDIEDSGRVNIRYCTPDGTRVHALAVQIVTTLKASGLQVKWNGSTSETIVASL